MAQGTRLTRFTLTYLIMKYSRSYQPYHSTQQCLDQPGFREVYPFALNTGLSKLASSDLPCFEIATGGLDR